MNTSKFRYVSGQQVTWTKGGAEMVDMDGEVHVYDGLCFLTDIQDEMYTEFGVTFFNVRSHKTGVCKRFNVVDHFFYFYGDEENDNKVLVAQSTDPDALRIVIVND